MVAHSRSLMRTMKMIVTKKLNPNLGVDKKNMFLKSH